MKSENILELLNKVIHPEYSKSIVELGMVESLSVSQEEIKFVLALKKARDPFANKLKRHAMDTIGNAYPKIKDSISIIIKEPVAKKPEKKATSTLDKSSIKNIIAISSCKGGVGKSTVTANLAATLAISGYSVGIIDADIYGPSMPKIFGLEDYVPQSDSDDKDALIVPAERHGVKVMSIGYFIKPTDALAWRGPMATNAMKQLIHQTKWGELDFLLIDLPPGTGDIHLTILSEVKIDGGVIVSTPQELAIIDVVRGIELFRSEHVKIPILGLIENMSWFTPKELPDNKYYIFGKEGCKKLAEQMNIPLLAQIPIIAAANDNKEKGAIEVLHNNTIHKLFFEMSQKIIQQL